MHNNKIYFMVSELVKTFLGFSCDGLTYFWQAKIKTSLKSGFFKPCDISNLYFKDNKEKAFPKPAKDAVFF